MTNKIIKVADLIINIILLMAFIIGLAAMTVSLFVQKEPQIKVLFGIGIIVLSGLIYAWFRETVKDVERWKQK